MDLQKIQLKELDMLRYLISILQKHNLSYYMLGGTLLGAIRHKGFIPWDDDIDIGIPRCDYEKLLIILKENEYGTICIRNFEYDSTYLKYFSKLENRAIELTRNDTIEESKTFLWIDIFPLDGMPGNFILRKIHQFKLLYRRVLLQYSNIRKGVNIRKKRKFPENILLKFGLLFSNLWRIDTRKQLYAIDHLLKKYPYDKSPYIVNFMGAYKFKEMFPKEYYGNGSNYQFEDLELTGPIEYHKVLTQMYGDYLTPPPKDQRFSHSITITGIKNE